MSTWTQLSERERIRVKAEAARFADLWRWQFENSLHGECVRMLLSCISGRAHKHVLIAELLARTQWGVGEMARFLMLEGGLSSVTIQLGCPEDDPDKANLVEELEILGRAAAASDQQAPWHREDLHPYVMTFRFQVYEGGAPVRLADK
jgi:hypothetical protein